MKVIDLLNKIANGEKVPEKIKWGEHYLTWFVYEHKALDEPGDPNIFECAGGGISHILLNDEIEIIEDPPKEDKKIKRIEERESGWWPNMADGNVSTLKQAINEIIDRLNGDE